MFPTNTGQCDSPGGIPSNLPRGGNIPNSPNQATMRAAAANNQQHSNLLTGITPEDVKPPLLHHHPMTSSQPPGTMHPSLLMTSSQTAGDFTITGIDVASEQG